MLDAAVLVISERGLADTRIADIAERAGASPALVIYHFQTRDRVLGQALTWSEERFYERAERELAAVTRPTDQLIRLIELSCERGQGAGGLDHWGLWLDMWARAPHDPDVARDRRALDARWRATIAEIVRRGQKAGEFEQVDADEFALRLSALMDGLAVQVVLGDPDVSAARMLEVCTRSAAESLGFAWSGAARPARRPRAPVAARDDGRRKGRAG
jgi:AcrR family transcriptional regulator